LINEARERAGIAVNRELTLMYWYVGDRIRKDILREERAAYGERIVVTVARQLTAEYGRGFTKDNLVRMMQFAGFYPENQIVGTLSQQLAWSHFVELLPIKDRLKREFYTEMCRLEKWSVRALTAKIRGQLYERTVLSGKPEQVIDAEIASLRETDQLTPDMIFRDPYLLDFLGLHDGYSERDLENAIIREMETFLLELGAGFAFVARQKRMTIDDEDFYLDLLFYHLNLNRFVAIELKLESSPPRTKARWSFICAGLTATNASRITKRHRPDSMQRAVAAANQLLELDKGDIGVAEYFTKQLPQPMLEQELQRAVRRAREQLAQRQLEAPDERSE